MPDSVQLVVTITADAEVTKAADIPHNTEGGEPAQTTDEGQE